MSVDIQACDFPALWTDRVNSGDVEKVVALYNEKAILMPTFSPHMLTTEEELIAYFSQLASRKAMKVTLHENTVNCQKIAGQSYQLAGIYSFEFDVDGTVLTFPSRFTFVIDLSKESPLLHHHSSQVPRNLS